jgi:hypothetical protein
MKTKGVVSLIFLLFAATVLHDDMACEYATDCFMHEIIHGLRAMIRLKRQKETDLNRGAVLQTLRNLRLFLFPC